jgi:hypothetical protein
MTVTSNVEVNIRHNYNSALSLATFSLSLKNSQHDILHLVNMYDSIEWSNAHETGSKWGK